MAERGSSRATLRLGSAALLALVVIAAPSRASAHAVGVSKGDYLAKTSTHEVTAELTFARAELASSIDGLDANDDGTVDDTELARGKAAILAALSGSVTVSAGAVCTASLEAATLAAPDGVDVQLRYACPSLTDAVTVHFGFAESLSHGHRHVAHLAIGPTASDDVLYRGHEDVSVRSTRASADSPPSTPATAPSNGSGNVLAWLRMGVEHILTGYDHIAFLIGLVLIGGRLRSLIGAVTAFTLAHSITLAMAALDIWSPPSRLVEVAIAASIVWVGVENFFVQSARGRWRITFPFGLIHGFGFAGALREIALPRAQVPLALVCFNAGVETGQLAVMALVIPALTIARARGWLGRRGTLIMSGAVACAGVVWFVSRLVT